jgi:hypothetical protein
VRKKQAPVKVGERSWMMARVCLEDSWTYAPDDREVDAAYRKLFRLLAKKISDGSIE